MHSPNISDNSDTSLNEPNQIHEFEFNEIENENEHLLLSHHDLIVENTISDCFEVVDVNEFDPYKSNCTKDVNNDSFIYNDNNSDDRYDKLRPIEEVDESME